MRRRAIKDLVNKAAMNGWRVELGGSGHYKMYSPDEKRMVVASATPRNGTAYLNARAMLRRAGLKI